MTLMSILLLVILFLTFFIYFSGLNPQDITLHYLPDHDITYPATLVILGCVLIGLVLGYLVHLYGTVSHLLKHWKKDRTEKKNREVSSIYREGVNRLLSGDVKKAHSLLQKALDRDPSHVETCIAMASIHEQEGNPLEALSILKRARDIEPGSLEVLFKLATVHSGAGNDDEASQVYRDILAIDGNNRKALRILRDIHIKHLRWEEALSLQKRILKAGPASNRIEDEKRMALSLRYEVARAALAERKIEEAKTEFKEIIKEAPDFLPARVSLGDAYKMLERDEDATRVWEDGYKALGRSIFLSRLEELYIEDEDPSTLLSFYRAALLDKPDDPMLRFFYGKLCLRLEMVDDALEQLRSLESSGIDSPQLHLLLGEANRRRNRPSEAMEEYQKALGINRQLQLGYVCRSCGQTSAEWDSRCPACAAWGSFGFVDQRLTQKIVPPEQRVIYHGER